MDVVVVKYNAGNVYSVVNALRRLGVDPLLTDDPALIRKADKVVFPGQGEAGSAMAYLRAHGLDVVIKASVSPFSAFASANSYFAVIRKRATPIVLEYSM